MIAKMLSPDRNGWFVCGYREPLECPTHRGTITKTFNETASEKTSQIEFILFGENSAGWKTVENVVTC